MATDILEILRTKRDGGELDEEQIRFFIDGYTAGTVADEQAAALCMAVLFRGMVPAELATWTRAMIETGERLDLSGIGRPTVDKHSTGGVGDKISLPLCPLVAACGAAVPQLAGRGLGHTGGTLDKMESFPGWRAMLTNDEIRAQLETVGAIIAAAGDGLAPADRKLYALRDVTATVEAIPLIASSIMSKKIAEGTEALVLDVKTGSGAFMQDVGEARRLAETMVSLGEAAGVRTVALLTDMGTPLGRAVGNAVEVIESVEVLQGGGPPDVVELTVALAEVMLELAGVDADPAAVLASGGALPVWEAMVVAQGGDPAAPMPQAMHTEVLRAEKAGFVTRLDARGVGIAAWRLGAGRARKEDAVSLGAGILCLRKPGEAVEIGEPILELRTDEPGRVEGARAALAGAFEVGPEPPPSRPLVIERVG
jgi:thymidine phosphorylase